MASAFKKAAEARKASAASRAAYTPSRGQLKTAKAMAAANLAAGKNKMSAGYSLKGSATYRGAVGKALRSGGSPISAHRAGVAAEQAYMG